jgi:hypothetical protein
MYRPQFLFPLPPNPCTDQSCMYSFDSSNLPVFLGTLLPGAQTGRIPLKLDKDADFYLRAIDTMGAIAIRLEDTDGNPLSDCDNVVNSTNFELQPEYSQTAGAGFAALESGAGGIFGPGGGNYVVYLFNPTVGTINLNTCVINLIGVKRYSREVCEA